MKNEREKLIKRLRDISVCKAELKMKIDWYNSLIHDFSPYKSPINSGVNSGTRQVTDSTYNMVALREKLTKRYAYEIEQLCEQIDMLVKEFDGYMEHLNANERMAVTSKYLLGMSWNEVAIKMNYEERQARRIHINALNKILKDVR